MNKIEYLLTCFIEECAEVQHETTKALRFGLNDKWKDDPRKQSEKIVDEFHDLMAIYEKLVEEGVLSDCNVRDLIETKKLKLETFMNYSRENGTLE